MKEIDLYDMYPIAEEPRNVIETSHKFCVKCGTQIEEDQKFCIKCGKKIS